MEQDKKKKLEETLVFKQRLRFRENHEQYFLWKHAYAKNYLPAGYHESNKPFLFTGTMKARDVEVGTLSYFNWLITVYWTRKQSNGVTENKTQ